MLIEIEHELRFDYDDFIRESFMELRVEPLTDAHQTLRSFYLAVGPPTRVSRYTDWNGNLVHHFGITDYHDRIEIQVRSTVETASPPLSREGLSQTWSSVVSNAEMGPLLDFLEFGGPVQRSAALEQLAAEVPIDADAPLGAAVVATGHHLFERFEYRQGVTDFRSSTEEILETDHGVCQDFAHVMLGVLRVRGIPSRYVSGYLHVEGNEGESQSHAWVEAFIAGHGWVSFDPTADILPDERYVVVGRGRNYDDVPPNRGIYRGTASEKLAASVTTRQAPPKDVASLHEEIAQLDVPVYQEAPRPPAGSAAEAQQQQQQQQ